LVVALGEEELGVIFVEDTVRDAGAIDATVDLDVRSVVGLGEVSRKTAVVENSVCLLSVTKRDDLVVTGSVLRGHARWAGTRCSWIG